MTTDQQEIEQAEDELWTAILEFANNRDPIISSRLAEDVSTAIINLKNCVHLSTKTPAKPSE
jgi:hypothetical protein